MLASKILGEIDQFGRLTIGKRHYVSYLEGGRLTQREAIQAKCYDCQGYCEDGVNSCDIKTCPLWPYSQFGGLIRRKKGQGEDE